MEKKVTTHTTLKECGVSLEITECDREATYEIHANAFGAVRSQAQGIKLSATEAQALRGLLSCALVRKEDR